MIRLTGHTLSSARDISIMAVSFFLKKNSKKLGTQFMMGTTITNGSDVAEKFTQVKRQPARICREPNLLYKLLVLFVASSAATYVL
jgi:hypothetical protein